jgi:hypothetical protein
VTVLSRVNTLWRKGNALQKRDAEEKAFGRE